jgi:UDP-N-acetyl-D-mannosaminuronate dehydrogenase
MFLNYLKSFFTKKIVKGSLANVKHTAADSKIHTIGIIFDESYFEEREALVLELVKNGIEQSNIKVLVFKDKIKKSERFDYPVFSNRDLSWTATFDKSEVKDFIAQKFDLLINYYDTEKPKQPLKSDFLL